ncbi:MAG: hypothetical protein R2784_21300 [Saprospiraceae bacterium]
MLSKENYLNNTIVLEQGGGLIIRGVGIIDSTFGSPMIFSAADKVASAYELVISVRTSIITSQYIDLVNKSHQERMQTGTKTWFYSKGLGGRFLGRGNH